MVYPADALLQPFLDHWHQRQQRCSGDLRDPGTFRFNGGTGDDQRDPIPAGESEYTLPKAYVPSTCTNKWTVDEVTVLGVVYHAHLVGKNLNIDVVRGGEQVGQL